MEDRMKFEMKGRTILVEFISNQWVAWVRKIGTSKWVKAVTGYATENETISAVKKWLR